MGLGVVIGVLAGAVGAWLLLRAQDRDWVEGIYARLSTLAVAILAFAGADTAGANGFIAAFVAGLAFATIAGRGRGDHLVEYTEDSGQLLAVVSFFAFGNLFVNDALRALSPGVVAALTLGRFLPVALAMAGTGAAWPTKAFVGWFGPRGLASIVFGLLLLEEDLAGAEELFVIIALTVVGQCVRSRRLGRPVVSGPRALVRRHVDARAPVHARALLSPGARDATTARPTPLHPLHATHAGVRSGPPSSPPPADR